jgi:PEP-CTERM motif
MRRIKTVVAGFVLAVLLPGRVPGQTVYSDGLNHNVSGASQAIELQNDGTSLTVLPGASITGSAGFQGGTAVTGGFGTAINLIGGTITGSSGPGTDFGIFGPAGIFTKEAFAAFGGTVTGGDATNSSGAGAGVYIRGASDVALFAGGTFQGGRAFVSPGESSGNGAAVEFDGGKGQILGGTFLRGGVLADGADLSISGGTFSSLTIFSIGTQTISGGTFQNSPQTGGLPGPVVQIFDSPVSISGGVFSAEPNASGTQVALLYNASNGVAANISGGLFSGAFDFRLSGGAEVNFIGSGLVFDPATSTLTGVLEDGSTVDSLISLDAAFRRYQYGVAPDGSEMVTFGPQGVPEPSSIVTFLIGAAAVGTVFVGRRLRGAVSTSEVAGA